jgi:SAM-dependent methyltransferase
MEKTYTDDFYRKRYERTKNEANLVLDRLLSVIPLPTSVIDIGCGVGTWLSIFKERGTMHVLGVEGGWVNKDYLILDSSEFMEANLEKKIAIDQRFDLAISLEVAEHLSPSVADQFIEGLTSLSDCILFSAAAPFQGGSNHVNEQPIDYWREKFESQGYVGFDFIRPYIWNDKRIGVWYRQNVVFFVSVDKLNSIEGLNIFPSANFYMHPDIFMDKILEAQTLKGSWRLFRKAFRNKIFSFLK